MAGLERSAAFAISVVKNAVISSTTWALIGSEELVYAACLLRRQRGVLEDMIHTVNQAELRTFLGGGQPLRVIDRNLQIGCPLHDEHGDLERGLSPGQDHT
jgi:hypothetical protein